MRLAIFSDTHLGFSEKTERCEECFENLEQAIALSLKNSADVMLLAGDIFDAPVPSHTTLYKSIRSFSCAAGADSGVKLTLEKGSRSEDVSIPGKTPIIAIHGNHEFLGKETRTALDVLNVSGLLIYLHAGRIVVQKGEERAFVYGLGAVPEKRALEAMQHWNPVPEPGHCNVLLVHQAFKEFMVMDDEMVATLSLEDIPKGFDLVVDGHLHWQNSQKLGDSTFLLAGSTISTSIKKIEAQNPKGVFFFDTITRDLSFEKFPMQRRMFYHKVVFRDADQDSVLKECRSLIGQALKEPHPMKPLIRLNLKGSLKKGLSSPDISLRPLNEEFSDRAILSLSKDFSDVSFKKKISELREIQKSRLSLASMGLEILEKNLKETEFGSVVSSRALFDMLSEDDIEGAMEALEERLTLRQELRV